MRLENNFVQVENNPAVINKVNAVAAAFGWTVQSIQVTDTSVAYQSGAVGWTTEFGTFVNSTVTIKRTTYASITYQRDSDDPKYLQWVELEREYNAIEEKNFFTQQDADAIRKHFNGETLKYAVYAIIATVLGGIIAGLVADPHNPFFMIVACIIVMVPGIYLGLQAYAMYMMSKDIRAAGARILKEAKGGNAYEAVKAANDRKQAEKQEVLNRAAAL